MRNTYLSLAWLGVLAMSALCSAAVAEAAPGPFAGPAEITDFAIFDACLPYLRNGGSLADYAGAYGRQDTLNDIPAIRLGGRNYWVGAGRRESGQCFVVETLGFAPALREAVFASFAKHGVKLQTILAPNDALLKHGRWYAMIEDYCFRIDGRVMRAHLTTSTTGFLSHGFQHTPLDLRLSWDIDDDAVKKGYCVE